MSVSAAPCFNKVEVKLGDVGGSILVSFEGFDRRFQTFACLTCALFITFTGHPFICDCGLNVVV